MNSDYLNVFALDVKDCSENSVRALVLSILFAAGNQVLLHCGNWVAIPVAKTI